VVVGDGGCEAYTTILWGALLSSEIPKLAEAETVSNVEGNMCGTVMRGADALPESKTASRRKGSRWNLGDLRSGRHARSASGRRGAVADDARAGEVGQAHSTEEVLEQSRVIGGGEDGGKAPGQGETRPATHAPGAEPDRRDTAAGPVPWRNCMGRPNPDRRHGTTRDRSPVRESRTPGSARGAGCKASPYRDRVARNDTVYRMSCFIRGT
jgi:hypothetical protein